VIGLKEDGGLMIDNPNPVWRDEVGQLVARVIAEKINPALALHGGSITLVDVKEGTAYVRMGGGCQGCSLRNLTLKGGIDQMIRNVAPGITQVIDVTRHEMGANPYYAGPAPLGGASPVAETAAPEG
jgi:Fe-S cluster biogenesis protein NfuA